MSYLRRSYLVRAGEEEELAVAALWGAGTLGVEVKGAGEGRVRLEAYFRDGEGGEVEGLEGVEFAGEEVVEEEDWFAGFRERATPVRVGRGFVVDPREPVARGPAGEAERDEEGRWLLRLPARGAFGTGGHESTRLALELVEEAGVGRGLSVLDVGTGTGILAFAALRLGARTVVALDVDPVAVFHARENGRLNGLGGETSGPRLVAGRVDCLAAGRAAARFDLAVANVVPEEILGEIPAVLDLLAADGGLILSGLLAERAGEVGERLRGLGLVERRRRAEGEWVGLRLERAPAGDGLEERRPGAPVVAGGTAGRSGGAA